MIFCCRARVICPLLSGPETMIVWDIECRARSTSRKRSSASCVKSRLCWRKEYSGLKTDQARRMKDLEKENQRLRRAISDLTLDKLILQETAKGNF